MNRAIAASVLMLISFGAFAQQSTSPATGGDTTQSRHTTTVRGCLSGERGNYILVQNRTSMVYVLKGVGNKLDGYLHQEVEVTGRTLPGTIKTGVRAEKAGSNPTDTVHGVDGLVLQVADPHTDLHAIAKHCKAADQE